MKYKVYNLGNFKNIPQVKKLSEEQIFDMEVVGNVLPFKSNNYVVEELINWDNLENDPIFVLTFPQKGMLKEKSYEKMANALRAGLKKSEIAKVANEIRLELNPHPNGQLEHNVPILENERLIGMQHKYEETVLFFPTQGQSCHAYCSFCFRWPQFTGMDQYKFAMKQADLLVKYLKSKPNVTDILFTGGDPMIMNAKILGKYINTILDAKIENLKTIRIGTKSLAFWPYRYLTDKDSNEILKIFQRINDAGLNLSIMAHFNHYRELETEPVKNAIKLILKTGAQIRTQSPLLNHINADPEVWKKMWKEQVNLGLIPYYFFVARDTGAQNYFKVSLEEAYKIYQEAYSNLSGICRTVRGPSMSAKPGKIQILGIIEVNGEKVFVLSFIQGRNKDWVGKPFFAKFNEKAVWLNNLKPAFNDEKFFYEKELEELLNK
ncbi:MAG: lysine 2,3-aminomutase [Bacteroidetes bacterium 4572_128]|nr:MAG: lysine 2,3-aminomutase [Bacteroidetes bacterium 4572_128]